MPIVRIGMTRCSSAAALLVCTAALLAAGPAPAGQAPAAPASPRRITIPFLANAVKPTDLDFMGAECDVTPDGRQMTCRFRQVFLTTPTIDASVCMITTSGYEQTFRRDTPLRWVASAGPDGVCGLVETTTLDDGGGPRWSMTIRTTATTNIERPECAAVGAPTESYDFKGVRRKLPCTFVQPGSIER